MDTPPVNVDGRILVPVRAIFEALGATVQWDEQTKIVTGIKGTTKILLMVDSKDAVVNDVKKVLDVPAKIINNRVLVPARFISESLGATVEWCDVSNTVFVYSVATN